MDFHTADPMQMLSDAWHTLRLSVQCPSRVRTWDAIVLTAASPDQAELYAVQLERSKQNGVIAPDTTILAVSDPGGQRIGSGAATLHAISSLAKHLAKPGSQEPASTMLLSKMHVLLLHTGGDSKRVPWANCIGKAFIPLPFIACDDPDVPVPTLFDHIMAISACALQAFSRKGGLLIMTGDVLPCFDAAAIVLPEDGVCVVTVPSPLDVASRHGVILSSTWKKGCAPSIEHFGISRATTKRRLFIVDDLLQKPNGQEMIARGAVSTSGRVLLDTGIFALQGTAWQDLIRLALLHPNPVDDVLTSGTEISLYEEMAGAWVPARHAWVQGRQLGKTLVEGLGAHKLYHYCSYEMKFFHFGTSGEILDHLAEKNAHMIGRRHFSSVASAMECEASSSAVIVASEILEGASVGDESLIFDCTLGSGVHIGARCVVMGIDTNIGDACESSQDVLHVPDWHCLWEVPLKGKMQSRVTLCCGVEDNPKALLEQGGTFCGRTWDNFMADRGIVKEDLWPLSSHEKQDLWSAKLFPVLQHGQGKRFALWLMGVVLGDDKILLSRWRDCVRLSFAEVHGQINFDLLQIELSQHRARLAAGFARASLHCGSLGRNLAKLSAEILSSRGNSGPEVCQELLALLYKFPKTGQVPVSRAHQAKLDLKKACRDETDVAALEASVWQAVAMETMIAVGRKKPGIPQKAGFDDGPHGMVISSMCGPPITNAKVELPVRIDFMGGWSDTPPWSLERIGRVLNMAILLEGSTAVGAEVILKQSGGVTMSDDFGNKASIGELSAIHLPLREEDPFRLIKAALLVLGFARQGSQVGLDIKTWANVPRGSGLGTSSILAVAVVKGLLIVKGEDQSQKNVANLVLLVEQVMGTGGGWQDQIGGLHPGIKYTTSHPGKPLTLKVETLELSDSLRMELEERLVLVFTGQVRLAHSVLERVVRRYLQRDARLIFNIKRLAELARIGHGALVVGDLDRFGKLILEAWKLNQQLDPQCSNPFVDMLFKEVAHLSCGYKLVGAGGGGFALILGHSGHASRQIKDLLNSHGPPVKVYNWSICL